MEDHSDMVVLCEFRPLRKSFAVRIAVLREIGPVCSHDFRKFEVGVDCLFLEGLEYEIHILAMRRAVRCLRMLVEIIKIYVGISLLGLKAGPTPCMPSERGVTCEVSSGLCNDRSINRICLEKLLGIWTISFFYTCLMRFCCIAAAE